MIALCVGVCVYVHARVFTTLIESENVCVLDEMAVIAFGAIEKKGTHIMEEEPKTEQKLSKGVKRIFSRSGQKCRRTLEADVCWSYVGIFSEKIRSICCVPKRLRISG